MARQSNIAPLASSPAILSLIAALLWSVTKTTGFLLHSPTPKLPGSTFQLQKFPLQMSATGSSSTTTDIPNTEELEQFLSVAITASQKAGEIILGNAGGAEVTKVKANSRDLLTLIDPLCEKTIRETIQSQFPTHDFLGEEDVPPGAEASAAALQSMLNSPSSSEYLWIVDPIDGTTNFVHGMPLCMPSVALAYKGEVVVGVIYDPHRKELFTAMKGQGARMNGEPISVSEEATLGDAIIAMGSPPAEFSYQKSLQGIVALTPKVRTIRMLGSAAIMLAWVACGRLTVYWEYDLSSWDVAAGGLLIREAGGRFTDLENREWDLTMRKICASNGRKEVHGEVLRVLNEVGVV